MKKSDAPNERKAYRVILHPPILHFQFVHAAAGFKPERKRQDTGVIVDMIKRIKVGKEKKESKTGKEKTENHHLVLSWLTTLDRENGRCS